MNHTLVRHNAKLRRQITEKAHDMRCYSLDNGFSGEVLEADRAPRIVDAYWLSRSALHCTLRTNGYGAFTLRIHSNLWFEFTSVVMAD